MSKKTGTDVVERWYKAQLRIQELQAMNEQMKGEVEHLEYRKIELETDVAFITRQRDKLLEASKLVIGSFESLGRATGVVNESRVKQGCEKELVALKAAIAEVEGK